MDLLGSAEIAALLGVSRQRVDQLSRMRDFPAPAGRVSGRRVWRRDEVIRWAKARDRL